MGAVAGPRGPALITVLCANPALDVTYRVERLTRGAVHPVGAVWRRAGGKGANVARVLRQLDVPVTLVAPLGGPAGEQYATEITGAGIDLVAVPIGAPPRTSVCVMDADATVFNEPGPELSSSDWAAVAAAVRDTAPRVLVLSGSVPAGVPSDAYAQLITSARDATTIVDAKGQVLAASLAARPDAVAPNLHESQGILGAGTALWCARELCARGARAAVVSDGADGLSAVTPEVAWHARPPRALDGNPTGAGDALTAALAWGLATGTSWPELLRGAVATAAAALARDTAGDVDLAVRADLIDQVTVEEVRDAARQHR